MVGYRLLPMCCCVSPAVCSTPHTAASLAQRSLGPACIAALRHAAQKAYPEERCGVLWQDRRASRKFGQPDPLWDTGVVALANSAPLGARGRAFFIAPSAWLAAECAIAALGGSIVGMYHSHPDRPPVLSAQDAASALRHGSNVIVSCERGLYTQVRLWRWCAACERFVFDDVLPNGSDDDDVHV